MIRALWECRYDIVVALFIVTALVWASHRIEERDPE